MKNLTLAEIRVLAEALGFIYRAQADGKKGTPWITFTYPDTNSHVLLMEPASYVDTIKKLGDELVRCGRIQQRRAILREINPFNYS